MSSPTSLPLITLNLMLVFSLSSPMCDSYNTTYNRVIMNPIDSCWRAKSDWATNRALLADCAVGFGQHAIGGRFGATYVVTDPSDDPVKPEPGTLRYGVVQEKPLWIIFAGSMVIKLKKELIIYSYKTIDGRGAKVEIAHGPCISLHRVSHVIIHGISIHNCKPGKPGFVRDGPAHVGHRGGSDGDGVTIFSSSNIWIDHCYLARCSDGLIDVIHASTAVTISNNFFSHHDKVMLFGHDDSNVVDKDMKVTVAFNHFGPGLVQRMPRVRLGYAHLANNRYDQWEMYAIGGSANPTIFSEGNYFMAPNRPETKQVTKRETKNNGWKMWKWTTSRDRFMNGAYFVPSGHGSSAPGYTKTQSFDVADGSMVPALTSDAGPLTCKANQAC